MTLEPLVMVTLVASGSCVLLAVGLRSLLDHAALALPVGVAVYAAIATTLVLAGWYSGQASLGLTVMAGLAVLSWARRRGHLQLTRAVVGPAAMWSAATLGLSLTAIAVRGTRVSADSFEYLWAGGALATGGGLTEPGRLFLDRQLLAGVLHDLAWIYRGDYLASLAPLFTVSGLLLLVWLYRRGTDRPRPTGVDLGVLVALALALTSTDRMIFNAFYVNSHLMVGVFVLVVAAVVILVAGSRLPSRAMSIACLAVVPIVVARPEATLLLAPALLPAVISADIDHRWRRALAWSFAGTIGLWWGLGLGRADVFGAESAVLASVATAVAVVAACELTRIRLVARLAPAGVAWLTHAVLWTALWRVVVRADREAFDLSIESTWQNVAHGHGFWGATILGLAAVVALGALTRLPRITQVMLLPLTTFVPIALLLGHERGGGYRIGPGDSLNRMWMHVLLLAAGYVVVAFTSVGDTARRGHRPPTPVPDDRCVVDLRITPSDVAVAEGHGVRVGAS